jgi:hypothetical protein
VLLTLFFPRPPQDEGAAAADRQDEGAAAADRQDESVAARPDPIGRPDAEGPDA